MKKIIILLAILASCETVEPDLSEVNLDGIWYSETPFTLMIEGDSVHLVSVWSLDDIDKTMSGKINLKRDDFMFVTLYPTERTSGLIATEIGVIDGFIMELDIEVTESGNKLEVDNQWKANGWRRSDVPHYTLTK